MKQVLFISAVCIAFSCTAQTIPQAVKDAFAKNFSNTSVKKWDKEDGGYEANFSKDGKTMSATFTATGVLKETETDINVSKLPESISNYIKTNYKGAAIKEAAIIVKGNDTMYEAEVKGKDLLFDMNGKFLKTEED